MGMYDEDDTKQIVITIVICAAVVLVVAIMATCAVITDRSPFTP